MANAIRAAFPAPLAYLLQDKAGAFQGHAGSSMSPAVALPDDFGLYCVYCIDFHHDLTLLNIMTEYIVCSTGCDGIGCLCAWVRHERLSFRVQPLRKEGCQDSLDLSNPASPVEFGAGGQISAPIDQLIPEARWQRGN